MANDLTRLDSGLCNKTNLALFRALMDETKAIRFDAVFFLKKRSSFFEQSL